MDVEDEIEVLSGSLLAHTAMMTAVLSILQRKGVLSQVDVNDIVDTALLGAETASGLNPRVRDEARKMLEQTAKHLGGRRRRW
jgi:hypothetical protein